MSSSLLITLEMAGVLGAVLVLGFYELWSLKRDKAGELGQKLLILQHGGNVHPRAQTGAGARYTLGQ